MKKKKLGGFIIAVTIFAVMYFGGDYKEEIRSVFSELNLVRETSAFEYNSYNLEEIPEYDSISEYIIINNNEPFFDENDLNTKSFEKYSDLDYLGRTGVAYANIGHDLMPTSERESIGSVKPSGWHTVKYDIVNGKYLYNRCHLIGFQLTGENANEKNLITCTRQMNVGMMLDIENEVAGYIKDTGNHVLYRATPIYEGDNLLANGVLLEGLSVEDNGKGIKFNIYVYNIQDGISIDYSTGESKLQEQ